MTSDLEGIRAINSSPEGQSFSLYTIASPSLDLGRSGVGKGDNFKKCIQLQMIVMVFTQVNRYQDYSLVRSSKPSQNSLMPELETTPSLQFSRSPWWSANSWLKASDFHRLALSFL